MNARKVVSLLLALLMVVTVFAACGGNDTGSTSSGTGESSAAEGSESEAEGTESTAEDDLMTPYGKYPELIELHTAKRASVKPNFVDGDTAEDNCMTRYIQDKLNVKTVIDWEVESTEFANKLSLMLASNDIPDMFTLGTNDYLLYRQLVENDLLADLSEEFEKCSGELMNACFLSFDYENLDPFYEGDVLYAIAGCNFAYNHNELWLRQDWLDKAGITELPTTIEDIENILTAWKENPPSDDYIGMALHYQDVGGGYGVAYAADPIFNAFGAYPKTWVRDENGEIVYGSVTPGMKEGLAVLADWYAKGLIDQQFATRTASGAMDALYTGGQTGAVFAPWYYGYNIPDLPRNDPEAEVVMTNAPLDADGKYRVPAPHPAGEFVMVRKDYEHPEAVVKVINCEFDMWRELDKEAAALVKPNRDAGVDWGYMFPTSGFNLEFKNCVPETGVLAKNWIENDKMECNDKIYQEIPSAQGLADYAKQYVETKSLDGVLWTEYTARYRASSPDLMYADNVELVEPAFAFITESMADLKPNLDTLERTTFLKIVMGELPLDAFDQFVEDWYAQGGQTMTDEVKAAVGE